MFLIRQFVRRSRLVAAVVVLATVTPLAEAARTHVVRSGEHLTSIAQKYGLTVSELARANKLRDQDLLRPGQRLQVPDKPGAFVEHKVARGESLEVIARRHGTTIADIRAHNALRDPDRIVVGQRLRIPVGSAPAAARTGARHQVPAAVQNAIASVAVQAGRWKHIVIHHSGTPVGSGKGMDRYHREERGMENGLAYHFVIGNGSQKMDDGEIFVGRRWTEQLAGGHVALEELNRISLGICLVGNLDSKPPTPRQLASLEALVRALQRRTGLPVSAVTTHQVLHRRAEAKHTRCPGRHFPTASFIRRLERG